jgi:hypothetical protein
VGNGCAGLDCDDDDDTIFDTSARSCYSGPQGTEGVGTCIAGQELCNAGVWGPCIGEVVPSGEACNNEDDDCNTFVDDGMGGITCGVGDCTVNLPNACVGGNVQTCTPLTPQTSVDDDCDGDDDDCDGAIDEDCLANCLWVTPGGDDGSADGTLSFPYATIQAAIDDADPLVPDQVCVAAGAACGAQHTYNQDVVMKDGVSVYGSYETTGQTQCGNWNTWIAPSFGTGVSFPDTISSTTVLDGFRIERPNVAGSAGVTINGATNVVVSNIRIEPNMGGNVQSSYGVNLLNGAEAIVTGSLIYGGNGSLASIGVRALGATVTVIDNCDGYDGGGRCNQNCGWLGSTSPGIRGHYQPTGTLAYAILLQDAPGSIVERSAVCGHNAQDGANVRITGDSDGVVVRANNFNGWGGQVNSHGVWLEDCDGDAPWIVDNFRIYGESNQPAALVDGVRAEGDCHPVIDSNLLITGGIEGGAATTNGVYCAANNTGASQCVVIGNVLISGSSQGNPNFPPVAVGVRCDDDACMRISNNTITGMQAVDVYGVWLQEGGTFVDNNTITGGCGGTSATGLYSDNSFARIQNNRIFSGTCTTNPPATSRGMYVVTEAGTYEIDVHSNVIDGQGNAAACTSYGVELDVAGGAAPAAGVGIFRNNIIRAGECNTASYGFYESDTAADPRIFENNDLDPYSSPTALYFDDTGGLGTAGAVDALGDMTASGTISVDPSFVGYPGNLHLQGGSQCDGAGTPAGAPQYDMDGEARDPVAPDIGADEI